MGKISKNLVIWLIFRKDKNVRQVWFVIRNISSYTKGHSFCKLCLQNFQFKKTRYSSPNHSKLVRADISCQFKKTKYLCRHCSQNECTLQLCLNFMEFCHGSLSGYGKSPDTRTGELNILTSNLPRGSIQIFPKQTSKSIILSCFIHCLLSGLY